VDQLSGLELRAMTSKRGRFMVNPEEVVNAERECRHFRSTPVGRFRFRFRFRERMSA
jgi:hypothetical protein